MYCKFRPKLNQTAQKAKHMDHNQVENVVLSDREVFKASFSPIQIDFFFHRRKSSPNHIYGLIDNSFSPLQKEPKVIHQHSNKSKNSMIRNGT